MEHVQSEAQPSEVEEVCGLTRGVLIGLIDSKTPVMVLPQRVYCTLFTLPRSVNVYTTLL